MLGPSQTLVEVSFGDCDPAGIVFYPNFFAWMDRAFHDYLRPLGGHAKVCSELGAVGIGVIKAEAQFRRPVRDGDALRMACEVREWGPKSLTLEHTGTVGDEIVLRGIEQRGVFCRSDNGMFAAQTAQLRQMVETFDLQQRA